MADHDMEKTEQATPKRLQETREKGQVAKSPEVSSLAVLMAGTIAMYYLLPGIYSNLMDMTSGIFNASGTIELSADNFYPFWSEVLRKVFITMIPFLALVAIAGVISNVLQIGLVFSPKALNVNFDRINPVEGIKKIMSLRSIMELFKSIIKITIVGYTSYVLIKGEFHNFPMLIDGDVHYIFSYMGQLTLKLAVWTGIVIGILAGIDLGFQKWQYAKNLRMTREEVKEEYKQQEGDPLVKSRIRSMQRETARKRMMADVPKADVVITNPTHLAVALSYKHGSMNAPKVVAKGAGFIAEKIREIARSNGVTVIENKPLARTLYKIVKVGEEIPANLYKAVAEILAYVYRLKKKG
ncbi:MAG: flagellar biosynthesis protein FlhB [Nitrospirae bacterium]|nr:flagellar biosynthesis protein FlhB [Nitrospirota bacterium]